MKVALVFALSNPTGRTWNGYRIVSAAEGSEFSWVSFLEGEDVD